MSESVDPTPHAELPAEELSTDEPTVDGSAREEEAGGAVAGTADGEPNDPTPEADEVAPTTDSPADAAALEESGGEHIVAERQ